MDWRCLLTSAGLGINRAFLRDGPGWWILASGLIVAFVGAFFLPQAFPTAPYSGLWLAGLCLWQPFWEELIFRGILLNALAGMAPIRRGFLSLANLLQATLFALAHLLHHAPLAAAATLVPALALGYLAERQGHIGGAFITHAAWNLAYFNLVPSIL